MFFPIPDEHISVAEFQYSDSNWKENEEHNGQSGGEKRWLNRKDRHFEDGKWQDTMEQIETKLQDLCMETRGIMRRQVCVTQDYFCGCSPMGKPDYFSGMLP